VQLPETWLERGKMMEKLEYFTIKPNLKQFYGKTIKKDTKFDEKTEDGCVEQHLEDLTLTTNVKRKAEKSDENPYEVEETSTMRVVLPENTILIWDEHEGFIVPQYVMTTLEELKQDINDIDGIYNREE
jgi:hypothetical protein